MMAVSLGGGEGNIEDEILTEHLPAYAVDSSSSDCDTFVNHRLSPVRLAFCWQAITANWTIAEPQVLRSVMKLNDFDDEHQ
uniref:Uncharacterized protein n=1 Tax=Glossina palpalis gambiensis TaxID=67801 RepID=A0A1B0ALX9_9MUSC